MHKITVTIKRDVPVKYLRAVCGVRYWEDASVNGKLDKQGSIPMRRGDEWCPVIDIDDGTILDWPEGVTADIHYKVCDEGVYSLLDAQMNVVTTKD